jgi:hypothetical protein
LEYIVSTVVTKIIVGTVGTKVIVEIYFTTVELRPLLEHLLATLGTEAIVLIHCCNSGNQGEPAVISNHIIA